MVLSYANSEREKGSIECSVNQNSEKFKERKEKKNTALSRGEGEISSSHIPGDQCEISGYRRCPNLHRGLGATATAEFPLRRRRTRDYFIVLLQLC